jgi:hypothetical protein
MANDLTGNPWLIDTLVTPFGGVDAAATVGNANTKNTRVRRYVDHMVLHGVAGTTDIVINDAEGRRVAHIDNPTAEDDIWYDAKTSFLFPLAIATGPADMTLEIFFGVV